MSGKAVVIGRGVIGASVALELARDGWEVVSLDRLGAAGHGSTSGSSGVIRTYYSTIQGAALAWEALHVWRNLAAHLNASEGTNLAQMRAMGCLMMRTGPEERVRQIADQLGIPYEVWSAEAVEARLPVWDLQRFAPVKRANAEGFGEPTGGRVNGALYWPESGYVADPMLAAQNFWDAAARHGAQAVKGEMVGLRAGARVEAVLLRDGGEIACDIVVNVAGPASSKINAMAGVTGDILRPPRPMRQEVVHLPSPPGFDYGRDGLIASDDDIGVYSRPERDGLLIGSQEPPCDPLDWVEDADTADRAFSDQWELQAMRLGQRIPSLGIPQRRTGVVEFYDTTPDWVPIYDRSSLPGFYMACGTSGNQFKNAPVVGRVMAEIIRYCEGGGDQDAEPIEVDLPRTGASLETGFFSRRRAVRADGPSNVLG